MVRVVFFNMRERERKRLYWALPLSWSDVHNPIAPHINTRIVQTIAQKSMILILTPVRRVWSFSLWVYFIWGKKWIITYLKLLVTHTWKNLPHIVSRYPPQQRKIYNCEYEFMRNQEILKTIDVYCIVF